MPSEEDSLQMDKSLIKECIDFFKDLKDKKLSSDQRYKKGKLLMSLEEALKKDEASSNGVESNGQLQPNDGELYLPMDMEELPEQPPAVPEDSRPQRQSEGELYTPMDEDDFKTTEPAPVIKEELIEEDQEEYVDVEEAKEGVKSYLSADKSGEAISPSPSTENLSGKKSEKPYGFLRRGGKRSSENNETFPLPDKSEARMCGHLEQKLGGFKSKTQAYWVQLHNNTLYLAKSSREDAVKLISLNGMTVEKAKGAVPQFDIIGPKKKDKMTFKSESAEINSMWVIELQSSILENKPVDNISITEKESLQTDYVNVPSNPEIGEELYDDLLEDGAIIGSSPSTELGSELSVASPSHRPLKSPLPDIPQPEESKAKSKTLKERLFKKQAADSKVHNPMPKQYIHAGHIYMYKKKGLIGGDWEKRYCVLSGEGKLYYSQADNENECKSFLDAKPHINKIAMKDAHKDKKVENHPFLMLIAKSTFAFISAEERKKWKDEIDYTLSSGLELDSEDEEETEASYVIQEEEYDADDIYEAFDEVGYQPTTQPAPPPAPPPELPATRMQNRGPALPPKDQPLIQEEMYEDADDAVADYNRFKTDQGLPPTSGPALPPRNPSISQSPLPPLPAKSDKLPGQPDTVDDIYDDTLGEQETYDDVENAKSTVEPTIPLKSQVFITVTSKANALKKPVAQKNLPKNSPASTPTGTPKGSPKIASKSSSFTPTKPPTPKSSPQLKKSAPSPEEPAEELYDDVESATAVKLITNTPIKQSPLVSKKLTSPPQNVPEEIYDDVEPSAQDNPEEDDDGTYMVTDNPGVTSPSANLSLPKSNTSVSSPGRIRLQSSGKVADMMKKFQQGDSGQDIKCKGRIECKQPGKRSFVKNFCKFKGSTISFYQSSVDPEPHSTLDVSVCELSLSNEDFNAKYSFKLSAGSVYHTFNCDSKREMDKWIDALKDAVKKSAIPA